MSKVKVKEIFSSIQGEGPYVGYKQLFIRFCGCNLNCNYCDTDFSAESDYREFTARELADEVNKYTDIHSISLTGGEPLLHADFLKEFLLLVNEMPPHPNLTRGCNAHSSQTTTPSPTEKCCRRGESYIFDIFPLQLGEGECVNEQGELYAFGRGGKPKIYLETNATLTDKFLEVKPFVDIISADIKLESATGVNTFELHEKFFEACKGIETFAKIVFNEKITDEEIYQCCELGKKYGIELILQPEMVSEGRKAGRQEGRPAICHYEEGNCLPCQREGDREAVEGFLPEEVIQPICTDIYKKPDCFADKSLRLNCVQPPPFNKGGFARNDKYNFSYDDNYLFVVTPSFPSKILDKFLQNYSKVRLIPQVHKFLNVR